VHGRSALRERTKRELQKTSMHSSACSHVSGDAASRTEHVRLVLLARLLRLRFGRCSSQRRGARAAQTLRKRRTAAPQLRLLLHAAWTLHAGSHARGAAALARLS
jgi:hypothetical protein